MDVSFTKISDDILVPTNLYDARETLPLSAHKWEWCFWAVIWLLSLYYGSKFGLQGIVLCTAIVLFFVFITAFIMKLPFCWVELNRKDGTVTVWNSPKKRRRIATGKFTDFRVDWTCRHVVTSKYSSQYRHSLGLYPAKGEKRFKKTLLDGSYEVQFCFLYDMASRDSKLPPVKASDEYAEKLTRKAEAFLNDFFAGKPLPEKKNNTYQLTP